ncbi:MAG: pyridine nucleotide-disulfide oxidoreductase [Spirochaetaceae bacterium]|nr:MAG: pyridine nucleotide-disulfide oxidoreductase [Spirochaetaceae bacterium]
MEMEDTHMRDSSWKKVARSEDIREGKPFSADLNEKESVLLVRKGESLFAWSNACPHVGCPLSWGHIHGDEIVCGCHNARFDITTGKLLSAPAVDDLPAYEVREEEGEVFVGKQHPLSFSMPAGSDSRSVVILGSGAGGSAAAESLRREGFAGRIVMITPEEERPYDRTLLSKFFLAGDMGFDALAMRPAAFYEEMKIELMTGRRATEVKPAARSVVLDDGSEVSGDFLVLATGAAPRRLHVPGADQAGVFVLRSFKEGQQLREAVAGAGKAVVIGASFIGTETAAYMVSRGIDVTVVAPESVPFEQVLGPDVGKRFVRMHTDNGVTLRLGSQVSRITGNGTADGVELSDGTVLPADLVVVGIGVTPVVDYIESSGLARDGAVPVKRNLETSAPGVYAIGDIAKVHGEERVEHWVVAQRHGEEVARSILGTGGGLSYAPFFWTRQFETSFAYIGSAPDYDETRINGDVENGSFLIGYFREGFLAAVGTMGKGKSLIRYGLLLDKGEKISIQDFEKGL